MPHAHAYMNYSQGQGGYKYRMCTSFCHLARVCVNIAKAKGY